MSVSKTWRLGCPEAILNWQGVWLNISAVLRELMPATLSFQETGVSTGGLPCPNRTRSLPMKKEPPTPFFHNALLVGETPPSLPAQTILVAVSLTTR